MRLLAFLFILSLSVSTARADEPRPTPIVQATVALTYPVSLKTGDLLPPSVGHGVGVLMPFKNGWGYYNEVGTTTGFAGFRPALQIITGPTKAVMPNKFLIGVTVLYKWVPPYEDVTTAHIIGGSVVPVVPTSFGALSFPLGVSHNIQSKDTAFAVAFKLAFRLN